jgi:hypothetical protein
MVQFSALGLIRQRGTIWELSGKGVSYVSKLLAIRKGETDASPDRWCALKWIPFNCTPLSDSKDVEIW